MKRRLFSLFPSIAKASVLLVQPLQTQWLGATGQPLPVPPPTAQSVRVVVDLIEETHGVIKVPALMGSDRTGFIRQQMQSLLPDVILRANWQTLASQPWLPKAFQIHAVGVASQTLQTALDQEVAQKRPVQGVWPLSYLMAQWAAKQPSLKTSAWLFLCLGLPHGLRMVLLKQGVPVFSRLLLDLGPVQQAHEISVTLKYLIDNRMLDRAVQPGIVLMQPGIGLAQALQDEGVTVLSAVLAQSAQGVLADVLALAGGKALGQMAPPPVRRYFLARQARQGLILIGALLALGGTWMVAGQAQTVLDQLEQTRQWQQQTRDMASKAQSIQQGIAASGVDTNMMRLTIEVKQRELQAGIDQPAALMRLGQLMQAQPEAELVRSNLSLVTSVCGGVPPIASVAGAGGVVSVTRRLSSGQTTADTDLRAEWQFEIRPASGLSPRTRQQVLDELGKTVRGWPEWQVHSDPVQSASGAVIASNQAGSGPGNDWRWCLSPGLPPPAQPS
jgi:hypothetical protein